MKRRLFFSFLFVFADQCATAQEVSDEELISKLPDAPAKANTRIFLHKIPDRQRTFEKGKLDIVWYEPMNDSRLFDKEAHELASHFDKWIYFLQKLETLDDIPSILRKPIFEQAFQTAEVANMSPSQRDLCVRSRLNYLEVKETVSTAEMDGIKKRKSLIAKEMKATGEPTEKIMLYTGLTEEEIRRL